MRRVAAVLFYWIFIVVFAELNPSEADAQWVKVQTFPSQVYSVYFLDQQGAGSTGFVGLANGQIWRTVDNGVTWNLVTTPPGYNAIYVTITDFTFKSVSQGWCSVRGFGPNPGGIWTTTNGGLNWSAVSVPGNMVSVAYCALSGELVATNWSGQAQQSANLGVSWNGFAPPNQDGVTFSGMNGVISNLSAPGFLYTADGGRTWSPPNPSLPTECWSPHGVPGTSMFFAVAEKVRVFYRSTNGGASWSNPYTFPQLVFPTGCVTGTLANLFVQTQSNGFYTSTDQGNSWYSICGPSDDRDTRFYSKDKEIFTGDNGSNLWYISDGTSPGLTVQLNQKAFSFSGLRCETTDSMLHFSYSNGCMNANLVRAQLLTGSPNFALGYVTVPHIVSGKDSVEIVYTPSSTLRDSGQLLLEFTAGGKTIDTIVNLYGTGQRLMRYNHDASLSMLLDYACSSGDSTLVIRNLSCDTLTLTSDTLGDSSHFTLRPISLPYKIAPWDSTAIDITTSSLHDGTFSTTLYLHLVGSTNTAIDDQVPLTLWVLQGAKPHFETLSVTFADRCVSMDTVFSITNVQCDSIVLMKAAILDTSYFQLGPIALPVTVPVNGNLSLPIHVRPGPQGVDTAYISLRYLSGLRVVDTTVALAMQVLYDLPIRAELSSSSLAMGSVNAPCDEASREIVLTNTLCRDLKIAKIAWEPPDSEYWTDPLALPLTLKTDSSVSILVHFKPNAVDQTITGLRITLDLDGKLHDTVLPVSGRGISVYHDTVLQEALQYDSLLSCQSQVLEASIINLSCDSIVATSAELWGNNGYSVVSPVFPRTLATGDTLHVYFRLNPNHTGSATDSVTVTLHNPQGDTDYLRTISLQGYVKPSPHVVQLDAVAFSFQNLPPCSSADSSFVVRNLGMCDDIVITSADVSGFSGITIDPTDTLPIVIHPGDSARIAFHIVPSPDSATHSWIALGGQYIDTIITVSYSARPGSYALALTAPDSIFNTRPCVPVIKSYTIRSVGCDSVTVDQVALLGIKNQSQFQLGGLPVLPVRLASGDSLVFTVRYDPNGNGNDSAVLEVDAKQAAYSRVIGLQGIMTGTVPSARIALRSADFTQAYSALSGSVAVIKIITEDAIGDSSALSIISFKLHYNSNLLTKQSVTAPDGWTVLDQMEQSDGTLNINLLRNTTGAISAGSELAECAFLTTVGDSAGCDITMSDLRFNGDAPDYERCTLASVVVPDPVRFTITGCGAPLIREMLDGQLSLRVISVEPNPVAINGGTSQAVIAFSLQREDEVTVRILDVLGNERERVEQSFGPGVHNIPVNLRNTPEGTYFAFIESAGARYVSKIVVLDR